MTEEFKRFRITLTTIEEKIRATGYDEPFDDFKRDDSHSTSAFVSELWEIIAGCYQYLESMKRFLDFDLTSLDKRKYDSLHERVDELRMIETGDFGDTRWSVFDFGPHLDELDSYLCRWLGSAKVKFKEIKKRSKNTLPEDSLLAWAKDTVLIREKLRTQMEKLGFKNPYSVRIILREVPSLVKDCLRVLRAFEISGKPWHRTTGEPTAKDIYEFRAAFLELEFAVLNLTAHMLKLEEAWENFYWFVEELTRVD